MCEFDPVIRFWSFQAVLTVSALPPFDHPEPELFHDEQSSQDSERICPQMPKALPLFWPAPGVAVHKKKNTFYITAVNYCDDHDDKIQFDHLFL